MQRSDAMFWSDKSSPWTYLGMHAKLFPTEVEAYIFQADYFNGEKSIHSDSYKFRLKVLTLEEAAKCEGVPF